MLAGTGAGSSLYLGRLVVDLLGAVDFPVFAAMGKHEACFETSLGSGVEL